MPILAFFIYGGWAAFVNSEYGSVVWIKAGLGQGMYALFSTWVVTTVTQKAFSRFRSGWQAFLVGFIAGFGVMLAIPLVIHHFLATPDVFEAIAPGLAWGSLYVIFVLRMSQKEKQEIEVAP